MNEKAIDAGMEAVQKISIPDSWKDAQDAQEAIRRTGFCPQHRQHDGTDGKATNCRSAPLWTALTYFPWGTTQYEKREIAVRIADLEP